MDSIATALPASYQAIGYPTSTPNPPQAIVGYPTGPLEYDLTFHANATTGKMKATIPIWFVVGDVVQKASRDALSIVLSDTNSVKQSVDGTLGGIVDYATVQDVSVETVTI